MWSVRLEMHTSSGGSGEKRKSQGILISLVLYVWWWPCINNHKGKSRLCRASLIRNDVNFEGPSSFSSKSISTRY
jgi:hypothetical protein